jgi:RimJ/RimL family protein N-acetyltransferase
VLDAVRHQARDTEATWERDYLGESLRDSKVRYFSIIVEGQLVGEIFLHDIGADRPDSALVGYALFGPQFRGQGFGTEALRLLISEVAGGSELNELVVITAADNVSSRRIAEKNGFVESGLAREDPEAVSYIWTRGS